MKNEAHWRIVSLEDVAEIQTGLSKNANRQGESVTLPYLRVANVQDGRFDLSEVKTIEVPKDAVERFRVRPGDVLLTEGGDFDKLGRGAVWRGQINECVHQNHIFVVRPNRAWLDERFLAYQTQGPRGRAYFQSCSKQSTNLASINSTQLRQFPTALPPLGEQRKIADILTTWDEALEKLDALIKAKEGRKKALMQQLLTGKKRLNGFVKPWKFVPLGRLLESADRYRKWDDGRVARLAGVRRNGGGVFFRAELPASEIKVKTAKIICEGDFLISRRQITYGGMAVVPRRFDGFEVNDEYEVLVSRDPDKMDIRFFGYLAHTPRLKHLAYLASNGFFAERLRLNFDLSAFLESPINVPTDVREQRVIADLLGWITDELTLLRAQRTALDQQKRGLMQRLLTGKLRVKP